MFRTKHREKKGHGEIIAEREDEEAVLETTSNLNAESATIEC